MSGTMQRQPRPSIVIDSGSGAEFDYPGSDVLIHKKDFLIHIKKLSLRSQSTDCASECSRKDSPAIQRRSSSAVTQRTSVATRNSLPVSLCPAKTHRSLERKAATGLKYSGSQSTSSIPRRVVRENQDKLRTLNLTVSTEKDNAPGLGPVTSILSFVGDFQQEHRKDSLIHGNEDREDREDKEDKKELVVEEENVKNKKKVKSTQSAPPDGRSNTKQASLKKPVVKKEETKAVAVAGAGAGSARKGPGQTMPVKAGGEKKAVRGSTTAPLVAPVRTPGKVKATKSLTAPVTPSSATTNRKNLTKTWSAPRPARAAASKTNPVSNNTGQQPVAVTGRGKKNFPYPKKVSSEYPNEILFKNQEGLKFSSVNFFEEEEGSASRRPSATLRQRLLGSTNSVSSKSSRSSRPEDRNQLTALWQQLKSDIETAMAKKPAGRRTESGQYKRFSVITKEARSESQCSAEQAWLEGENVWLVHRDGFAAGRQVRESEEGEALPEGRVRVKLDYNSEVVEVDEDDVEKANPPSFDRVEDLAQLRYLNESSVLHTLRQRYVNNLIQTYAGPSMITINPCKNLDVYSDKIRQMFKECKVEDLPPHIYSVGQAAYKNMMTTKKDQSVAFIGRSGSGKTTNFKHVLTYLASAGGCSNSVLTPERLSAINALLEAFGNTRTVMNANATRFSQVFSVDFDHSGVICSASVQVMMLEKTRVVRRPDGEPNFNIFYQMLAGLDSKLRREFQLDNLAEPNIFMTPLQRIEDKASAAGAFSKLSHAASVVNISQTELKSLWSVLSCIYHLGCAGVARSNLGRAVFGKPQSAQRAAQCLGVSLDDLTRAIFQGSVSSGTLNRNRNKNEATALSDGLEALQGFAVGLYAEVFHVLVALINRAIATPANTAASIIVVDMPGFQNPATCGRPAGASFEELCHNYSQERLQLMFHDRTITALKEKYEAEEIALPDLDYLSDISTPQPLVRLIDKQSMARASQSDLNQTDKRGLLWLLDEEAIFPGSSDESFVERLLLQYSDRNSEDLIKKGPTESHFILQHFQGTNPVLYNSAGWLKSSRESPNAKTSVQLLHESADRNLSDLFLKYRSGLSTTISGSFVGVEGNQSLRRASSIRRAFTTGTAGIKRHSAALQVKFQIDGLIEQLRRSRVKFVHCFLPQHTAGLCDVRPSSSPSSPDTVTLNIPLIRSQLRGSQLLDAVRLHKIGFPESFSYPEFWRRFSVLTSGDVPVVASGEERKAVEQLLEDLDIETNNYRLGNTQVFLRSGIISQLEEERYERLGDKIVSLQAYCRGFLARRSSRRLRSQDLAIRCIQKNVRKFVGVRDWGWWRLLIKVTPLLNVHRTEEQLKAREDEVDKLRSRLEKLEVENKELKMTVEKQDSRISDLTADLSEEHSAATLAAERLEAEQADRVKLEKEKLELVSRTRHLTNTNERLEMEVLHSRALEMNGSHESDDDEANSSVYKSKYDRVMKDLDYTKRRMNQQHEDDLEQMASLKKQLEKKLNDAYEEVEDQRQVVAQWKRKVQKLQAEMNDTRLHLEEQASRNTLLEKKQRKFDSELALAVEDKRQEMISKEKYQNEVDLLRKEKSKIEEQSHILSLEAELKDQKILSLTKDLEINQTSGGGTEDEFRSLKKLKLEYEMKLKDQEEELDDLAGQIQMLESNKTRLDMEIIQMRKEFKNEVQSREDELDDMRNSNNKKVKLLEQQLEMENEERKGFVRERHELELRIRNLEDLLARSGDEEQIIRLKRDLKRTKALLRDAQLMLEKAQNEGSNKVLIRQLKNQLEDAEFARTAALKGKQNAELELADVQQQLDDIIRTKGNLEEKHLRMAREKADLSSQLEENEEEMHDIMRKYKASVAQVTTDQITIQDQASNIHQLEDEKQKLKEQLAELCQKVDFMDVETVSNLTLKRLEMKIRELESKLELEVTTKGRMDTQIGRLKETIERLNKEMDDIRIKEQSSQDQQKKLNRQLRELKEDYATLQGKEGDLIQKNGDLEKQMEVSDVEVMTLKSDLKLAMKRIEDLQVAISGDIDSESYSDQGCLDDSDDESAITQSRLTLNSSHDIRSCSRLSDHEESQA